MYEKVNWHNKVTTSVNFIVSFKFTSATIFSEFSKMNLNSQRLEHIKRGESVFEAILHFGGKASFPELVKRIANSVSQPEDVVRTDVKNVLRAAVINGYLVRHGKDYLLSRSCRTYHTDSRNRITKPSSGRKSENVAATSTFRYPTWWSRFWNRFVVFKQNQESCFAQGSEEQSSDGFERNNLDIGMERDTPLLCTPSAEAAVPLIELKATVFDDSPSVSLQEIQAIEPNSISSVHTKEPGSEVSLESVLTDSRPNLQPKELANVSLHSVAPVIDSNVLWTNNELKEDGSID